MTARGRSGPSAVGAAACLAALLAGGLTACTASTHDAVPTTVVPLRGTCDRSRVVEVGASLALSGPQRALGQEYLTGLQMAVDHLDEAGGILNDHRCLELLYKDDQGRASVARQAVLDLVNREQVTFLVSPFLSTQTQRATSALAAANVPVSSFSSLDETFRRAALPWTFPVASSTTTMTRAMVEYARAQGWHQLAIAAVDDPLGRQGASSLARAAQRAGMVVSATAITTGHQAASALERLRATQPDGLAVVGDTLDVGAVLQARQAAGWEVPVVASSTAVDPSVVRVAGDAGLSGVAVAVPQAIVAQPGISDAGVRHFRDSLRADLHHGAIDGSILPYAQGYDAVAMLASSAESSHSITASNVRTFLESAGYEGLLASYQYTTGSHSGIPPSQQVVAPAALLSDGLFAAPGGS
jgi:branched-chain amino acid transport system substrate-binding protein